MFKRFFLFMLIILAANCDAMLASISKHGGMNFANGMMYRGFANIGTIRTENKNNPNQIDQLNNIPKQRINTDITSITNSTSYDESTSELFKRGFNDYVKSTKIGYNFAKEMLSAFKEDIIYHTARFWYLPATALVIVCNADRILSKKWGEFGENLIGAAGGTLIFWPFITSIMGCFTNMGR